MDTPGTVDTPSLGLFRENLLPGTWKFMASGSEGGVAGPPQSGKQETLPAGYIENLQPSDSPHLRIT